MDSQRLFERIDDFHKALQRLHEVLIVVENDIVRDAVIQRFEFTYEMAWKALKLWLEAKHIEAHTSHEVLREALQAGMIADGNGWTEMQRARNKTSHTYDENQAIAVVNFIRAQGIKLFDALRDQLRQVSP